MREREAGAAEANRLEEAEAALRVQAESHRAALGTAEQRLARVRTELGRVDKQQRQLESGIARARERITVLTELEQRLEGLEGGVQQVLRMAREETDVGLSDVRGVVADLFHVDIDTAHLIEAALSERAQFVVVASATHLLERLQQTSLGIAGKVGFLRLDTRIVPSALDHVDLSAEAGVMGRADQFIETSLEFAPLVKRLLGRTWLVDRLTTALRLSQSTGRGLDFVTSDAELLTADGTLVIGSRSAAAGIMSRRSELRSCHEQVSELEVQMAQCTSVHARLDQERAQQEALVASSVSAYGEMAGIVAERHKQTTIARVELEQAARDCQRLANELEAADERIALLDTEIRAITLQRSAAKAAAADLQDRLNDDRQRLGELQAHHAGVQSEFVERQLAAARCEQRADMLRQQWELSQRSSRSCFFVSNAKCRPVRSRTPPTSDFAPIEFG
jgi:chromosome segregation ATPase